MARIGSHLLLLGALSLSMAYPPGLEKAASAAKTVRAVVPSRCGLPGGHSSCSAETLTNLVYLPVVMRATHPPLNLPVGFNSGGEELVMGDGKRFLRDQAYLEFNGAGYVDGAVVSSNTDWEPIDGTDDDRLYYSARAGLSAYRFNVPNGHYLVELHMAEVTNHGPYLRSFDVSIEDLQVLRALDLYGLAQHDYAVRYRFAAEVQDGVLDVTFSGRLGQPLVSAIWVKQRTPDSQHPAMPVGLRVVGGYRRAILRWLPGQDDDIAGYRVYRSASPDGPFHALAEEPTPLARFFDDSTAAGSTYCYRVAAVDVFGNEGPHSAIACDTIVDHEASTLPILDLEISPGDLYALASDPFVEVEVPGTLTVLGQQYQVTAQYRGRSTRGSNKKSWRVVAEQPVPAWLQNVLLLNGEGYDPAMIRDKVAFDLFEAMGIRPVQSRFVHLNLNGAFIGVFTQVENPDIEFLRRTGRNPNGDVFKCADGLDLQPSCTNQVVPGRGEAALYELAAIINRTPATEFAAAISDVLDVRAFLDYQSIKSVIADPDSAYQYLLYNDPEQGLWEVLPWDNNVAFNIVNLPIDYGTAGNPGWGEQVNILLTRVLQVPQYRRYYGDRVLELTTSLYSSSNMSARFDAAKTEIWFDAQRDVWKAFREQTEHVATHISYLPVFTNRRIDYLRSVVPSYIPAEDRFIGINELMTMNGSTAIDPADGQAEPWFEIVNAGLSPVDIGGMFLTDSMGAPTRFRIPTPAVLPPLGSLLFWADGEPEQGPNHVNFTLSGAGGELMLVDRNGTSVVDALDYPSLPLNVSFGRFPDQSGTWLQYRQPTPGQPNRLAPPTISSIEQTPLFPRAGDVVTVTAVVVDDGRVGNTSVIYGVQDPVIPLLMYDDGSHGDGAANDGRYGIQLPAHPNGTAIRYYLSATDDYGRTAFHPAAAPVLTLGYRVGYRPPTIAISEFMAANRTTAEDPEEPGEFPDWIELANTGEDAINLRGHYLTDNILQPRKFRIDADVIVPPGGTAVFWADDDPEQGPLHTNFKLNREGETVAFIYRDGATEVAVVNFPAQIDDVSFGKCLHSGEAWGFHYLPTPSQPNACAREFLPFLLRQ